MLLDKEQQVAQERETNRSLHLIFLLPE